MSGVLLGLVVGVALGLALAWQLAIGPLHRDLDSLRRQLDGASPDQPLPPPAGSRHVRPTESLRESVVSVLKRYQQKLSLLAQQRKELDAVLTSMVEGVVAVDNEGVLFTINRAAASMFAVDPRQVRGRRLVEVVRNPDLRQLIEKVLQTRTSHEAEFTLFGENERIVRAQGAALQEQNEPALGAVVVLEDITQLKRLEQVRRDFVANVSHELKTPITSIKGYVETIVHGDVEKTEDIKRFLNIVMRQSDRLNSIIDDLLALSHLEQGTQREPIRLSLQPLAPVLTDSIEVARAAAEQRRISLELVCAPQLTAQINAPLLEQAVTNLLDNACKYSEPETTVRVMGEEREGEVWVHVDDEGCGIEAHHLPRIFERFYRVDKSRSRKLGGTGLGLAIVKHIAQVHGGDVSVTSRPGSGSRFTIRLKTGADSGRQRDSDTS